MCISQPSPARCLIVIFWYTETDAERKGTGRGRIHPVIGMIVAVFPISFDPPVNHPAPLV